MAAVDHDARRDPRLHHLAGRFGDTIRGVVDRFAAPAQDDVAIGVSGGDEDGGLPMLCVTEKRVRVRGGEHGVDGYLDVAGGGVLESHWTGHAGHELTMDLALRGASADGTPTDEAGDVLRRDHIQKFSSLGQAFVGQIEEKIARKAKAVVDFVRAIEMRVVDEALPAYGGAGLLKIDTHDDAQILGELSECGFENGCVFARSLGVMDRTGSYEDEETRVALRQDARNVEARIEDGGRGGFANGSLFFKKDRREDDGRPLNANVFNGEGHGSVLAVCIPARERVFTDEIDTLFLQIYQDVAVRGRGLRGRTLCGPGDEFRRGVALSAPISVALAAQRMVKGVDFQRKPGRKPSNCHAPTGLPAFFPFPVFFRDGRVPADRSATA